MGEEKNSGQDFIVTDDLLGEFKDHPVFEQFKGRPVQEVFKSYDHAHKLTADRLTLPVGKNDRPEVWEKVYDALGRPKDPSGYQFQKPELPGGLQYDPGLERAFAKVCHEAGILPRQAQALFNFYNSHVVEELKVSMAERDTAYGRGHDEIHEKFGNETDLALKMANRMLHTFGGTPEEIDYIAQNYGNDPKLIALLARVGMTTREDSLVKGEKAERYDGKDSAISLKKQILTDKNHPLHEAYFDKRHPRHQEAIDTVLRLNTLLHGGGGEE